MIEVELTGVIFGSVRYTTQRYLEIKFKDVPLNIGTDILREFAELVLPFHDELVPWKFYTVEDFFKYATWIPKDGYEKILKARFQLCETNYDESFDESDTTSIEVESTSVSMRPEQLTTYLLREKV